MQTLTFTKANSHRIKSGLSHTLSLVVFVYLGVNKCLEASYLSGAFFLLFSLVPIISLFKIITKSPTLVVNQEGITNNTNMMGLIKWDYIDRYEIKKIIGRRILVIHLNDPDAFLASKNLISRTLMKTNTKKLGSPAAIGEIELNEPLEDIIKKIKDLKV
jgi:hypothetical protein